jgi:hypothetical protein
MAVVPLEKKIIPIAAQRTIYTATTKSHSNESKLTCVQTEDV